MNSIITSSAADSRATDSATGPLLDVDHVTVRFGANTVLDDLSLAADRGEVLCLLGPSGSGKSTLLRCIAGIDRPASGRITIDGVEVAGPRAFVEPEQRRVGMVFQDYALFPHLTVAANVAFGLPRKHPEKQATVTALLQGLGLEKFAASYPHNLSGGERQRVALARALAPAPRILLMDEPFSSLDSRLRDEVRRQTLAFLRAARITTVIVTHDPDEALRSGDRIALIDGGRLVQSGSPETLYQRPRNLFAARFFSDVTPVPGICGVECGESRVVTVLGSFPAPDLATGTAALVCLRPQHVRMAAGTNGLPARVVSSEFRGDSHHLLARVEGLAAPLVVCVPQRHYAPDALAPGATIHLEIGDNGIPVVAAEPLDPLDPTQQGADSDAQ